MGKEKTFLNLFFSNENCHNHYNSVQNLLGGKKYFGFFLENLPFDGTKYFLFFPWQSMRNIRMGKKCFEVSCKIDLICLKSREQQFLLLQQDD